MRLFAGCILLFGIALSAAPKAVAGEHEDALVLVDQAIKAHGGADALNKAQALVRTGVGTMTLFGETTPFTDEVSWSLPERLRVVMDLNKQMRMTIVVNGDKAWQSAGGPSIELSGERVTEMREEVYVIWVATLAPLKKEPFMLSVLPEIKVSGEPAIGVKVISKAKPELKLYFDKKTNLLVKIERRATQLGQKVDKEYLYSDHKEFDGVKLPTKLAELISGRKLSELTVTAYKLKKVDDSVFAKP